VSLLDTFVASYAVTLCVLMIIVPLWSESKSYACVIIGIAIVISGLAFFAVRLT
jgi:hypothetical protein